MNNKNPFALGNQTMEGYETKCAGTYEDKQDEIQEDTTSMEEKLEEIFKALEDENIFWVDEDGESINAGNNIDFKDKLTALITKTREETRKNTLEEVGKKLPMEGTIGKLTPFQETVNTYISNRLEELNAHETN